MKNKYLFQVLFFITLIAIEYLATTTKTTISITTGWDKSNHFIAFFVLYILLYYSYFINIVRIKFTLLMLFAIQIEIVQYFIPNRFFSLLDILADGVGIVIGVYFVKIITKK